jgi:hypothetical protein
MLPAHAFRITIGEPAQNHVSLQIVQNIEFKLEQLSNPMEVVFVIRVTLGSLNSQDVK